MRILLLAPPGSGKGTQGKWLAARYGVRHIAAGDLLRAEAQAYTPAGREIAAYQGAAVQARPPVRRPRLGGQPAATLRDAAFSNRLAAMAPSPCLFL